MDLLVLCGVVIVSIFILGYVRKRVRTTFDESAQQDPAKAKKRATLILLGIGAAAALMVAYLAYKHFTIRT